MGLEQQLEEIVRRALREELTEIRSALTEQLSTAAAAPPRRGSPTPASDDAEVDTKAAAALAHVQPRTINEWKRRGWLTPLKRGRSHVFRAGDVVAVARDRGAPRKILDYEAAARRILERKERSP